MVKRWEALADGFVTPPPRYSSNVNGMTRNKAWKWISRQQKKVTRGLETAAHELSDKKWCDGNVYTLGDIAIGCALGYLAFRFP